MFIEKQTCSQGRLKESDYELRERRNKWKELATLQQRCSSMYTTSIRQHRILKDFLDRGINPELFLSYLLLYLPWSINTTPWRICPLSPLYLQGSTACMKDPVSMCWSGSYFLCMTVVCMSSGRPMLVCLVSVVRTRNFECEKSRNNYQKSLSWKWDKHMWPR